MWTPRPHPGEGQRLAVQSERLADGALPGPSPRGAQAAGSRGARVLMPRGPGLPAGLSGRCYGDASKTVESVTTAHALAEAVCRGGRCPEQLSSRAHSRRTSEWRPEPRLGDGNTRAENPYFPGLGPQQAQRRAEPVRVTDPVARRAPLLHRPSRSLAAVSGHAADV